MPANLAVRFREAGRHVYGEKREVTVLCLELGAPTSGVNTADAEEHFLAITEFTQSLAAFIYEYEGHIDKFHDNRLTALFGAPVAHEDLVLDLLTRLAREREVI